SMAVHKSSRTSDRLAPFAIISSLRFSAANRDSACDGVVVFGPCFDSHSAGRTTLAALLNCVPWSGLRRDSGEFIIFSLLGSALRPFALRYHSRPMHAIEARLSNFRVSKLLKRRSAATVMLSRTKHLALLCNRQLRFLATLGMADSQYFSGTC